MFTKVLKSVVSCYILSIIINTFALQLIKESLKKDVKINLNQDWVLIIETLIFYVFHNFAFLLEQ